MAAFTSHSATSDEIYQPSIGAYPVTPKSSRSCDMAAFTSHSATSDEIDRFVPDLQTLYSNSNELLSQIPQKGRDFLLSFPFCNAMIEAAREANTQALFNVKNKAAVMEFVKFLTLKIYVRDTLADKISPTPLMDAVWHQLILNTQVYEELQNQIELKLHHRPSGASDAEAEARKVRLVIMESLYFGFFESKPLIPGGFREFTKSAAQTSTPTTEKKGTARLTIRFPARKSIFVDVEHGDTIAKILSILQGWNPDMSRLVWESGYLAGIDPWNDLGMVDGDSLYYWDIATIC